jgi:hypothetical protein
MRSTRIPTFSLFVAAATVFAGCGTGTANPAPQSNATGNPITGEGLPNPAPHVTANWGQLTDDREWGTSAGIVIDPTDGHVWAYERCGSGSAGGPGVNCDTNPVDPVIKFDRHTGEILRTIGGGVMVTPHGLHVDREGNVWVTDFAANAERTKGHQVHKFSPTGELLMSLGTPGQAGTEPGQFNQPNAVAIAPDGSIFVSDGHSGQGMTTNQASRRGGLAEPRDG